MTTVTKTVKRYGNSGGIYLPSEWIGGKVKIELVKEALNPRKDLLSLPLEHIVCIILYGSYVRGEMAEDSDIDVILVTDKDVKLNIPSEILKRYDIQIKNTDDMRKAVINDPVLYKVITDESIALMNHQFLDELKNQTPKMSGIKTRLDLMKSSVKITNEILNAGADPSDLAYPLVMRLKEILIIECINTGRHYNTAILKEEILGKNISLGEFNYLMAIYRAARNNKRTVNEVSKDTITKLAMLLEAKMLHVEQKTLKKRNRIS